MKNKKLFSEKKTNNNQSSIPSAELADFLDQLSKLYSSSVIGNPALAIELHKLAASVRQRSQSKPRSNESTVNLSMQSTLRHDILKALDHQSIERLISDETKKKSELLDLAVARFSIPRSQLMKMKISDIRQAILSALLHESSIEIIAEEANRDGKNRSS